MTDGDPTRAGQGPGASLARPLALEVELSKSFGPHPALDRAKLAVRAGTVHALVGENGAGKSTLVKIVAGVVGGWGRLAIHGRAVDLAAWDRRAARASGVGVVQQHGAFAGALTVVENAVLGVEPTRGPLLDLDATAAALADRGRALGLAVDAHARVDELGLGAVQRAEIVSALYGGASLLLLDEPTAVLAPVEVDGLLARLRALAHAGTTVVVVTHKLDEVRAVADEVTVLRAGRTVRVFGSAADVGAIAEAMVGQRTAEHAERGAPAEADRDQPPALAIAGLTTAGLAGVSLTVARGELVGIAGVDGNGQRELALAIAGLVRATGHLRLGDRDATAWTAGQRLARGLAHVPEDRHDGGLWLSATVADNLALGRRDITGGFRVDAARIRAHATAQIAALDIRPPDPDAIARTLSGGNQQKIVIARELSRPDVVAIVAAQPTRGVDLGASANIHDRLRAAARAGAGVLVISADLDELLALCDRVAVMLRGRIAGELAGDALRAADARGRLGALMTGAAA
jgi:simple sugar transport system ATP-binding protein|nr:ATP-binding cassette domain-containing protein [Kofleriaceae bacterium]